MTKRMVKITVALLQCRQTLGIGYR